MVAFHLVAIWMIVATMLVWFVRDEQRLRTQALDRAARFFATAPQYRHVVVEERPSTTAPRRPVRSAAGDAFVSAYAALSRR